MLLNCFNHAAVAALGVCVPDTGLHCSFGMMKRLKSIQPVKNNTPTVSDDFLGDQ